MADEELVRILKRDVGEWNACIRGRRLENRSWRANLVGADLCKADLSGATLTEANLSRADLRDAGLRDADLRSANLIHANLVHADLAHANLRDANLSLANLTDADLADANLMRADLIGATLTGADLRDASLAGGDFTGAKLYRADLTGANLGDADFGQAQLTGTCLIDANLEGANFSGASLAGAKLTGASLSGADLSSADLTRTDLADANLSAADLSDASLRGANLMRADLSSSDLSSADLAGSDLRSANLMRADLTEADLTGANLSACRVGATGFGHVNLARVNGLASADHRTESVVGTKTLALSKGKMPDVFLKGCGLSDWEILNARLYDPDLTEERFLDIHYEVFRLKREGPIQISPVFLSYSRKDSGFIDKLQKALDAKGIRTWRDTTHAEAGPLDRVIDRAISVNRISLLVLSKHSCDSDWVRFEIEKALELEKKLKRPVLCPVSIDGVWLEMLPPKLLPKVKDYNVIDLSEKGSIGEKMPLILKGLQIHYSDAKT